MRRHGCSYRTTFRRHRMMDNFSLMTHDWSDYFSAMAQISGSLVGLACVALTFNPRLLGTGRNPILGMLARQAFADFILLLVVSLVMLTPHLLANEAGGLILGLSAGNVLRVAVGLWRQRAQLFGGRASGSLLLQRFILSFVGHVMIGWTGVELMLGDSAQYTTGMLLLSGTLMLLLAGCRSAWLLVTHEEKYCASRWDQCERAPKSRMSSNANV